MASLRLSSGSSTGGMVSRAPELASYIFYFIFFIEMEFCYTRLDFDSWSWCCLVSDNYILDGSYVTSLSWPVFTLISLGSDLIAWKICFPVLLITASLHIIHPYEMSKLTVTYIHLLSLFFPLYCEGVLS